MLVFLKDFPAVICNTAIYAEHYTLLLSVIWLLICDNQSLASKLESDVGEIVEWGRKWLVDFSAGKAQFVLFYLSSNSGAIDQKIDGFVLEEKRSFKIQGLSFSSKIDWGSGAIDQKTHGFVLEEK